MNIKFPPIHMQMSRNARMHNIYISRLVSIINASHNVASHNKFPVETGVTNKNKRPLEKRVER